MTKYSDLDWIFKNGPRLVKKGEIPGRSIDALWHSYSDKNIWGSNGTGYRLYVNSFFIAEIAKPFLLSQDKQGFLDMCKKLQSDKDYNLLIWKEVNEKLELAFQNTFNDLLRETENING